MDSGGTALTTYGGQESEFGFAAVFRTEIGAGIAENISVDGKDEFTYGYNLSLIIEIAADDDKNHLLTAASSRFTFSLFH